MSDHDEFSAFLAGLIVGGLTGAIAALLFAPQSGEETRSLIKHKSIELRDSAQQSAEKALARANEIICQIRESSKEGGSEAKVIARLAGNPTTIAPPPKKKG